MPPPHRAVPGDYHFYAYDNDAVTAWTPGTAQNARGGLRFYSMIDDLTALQAWGAGRNVPNIAIADIGAPITATGTARATKLLSFGGPVGAGAANAPAVVITGGIHAREWAAPTLAYLLAEYLVMNYQTAPTTPDAVALKALVDSRRLYFVPMLNPDGNNYTVYSAAPAARLWRKNRRAMPTTAANYALLLAAPNPPLSNINLPPPTGSNLARYEVPVYRANPATTDTITVPAGAQFGVDLNRNSATPGWGNHCPPNAKSGNPSKEDYFGPRVASEIETLNIQAELANIAGAAGGLAASIDYHAYGKMILYPSEASYGGLVNAQYVALGQILQKLIGPRDEPFWSYDYSLGTPAQTVKYDAVGTLADYIALSHGARAFVVELDPSGDPGFLLPEDQIQTVFEKNLRGALALIAAGNPSAVNNTRNWLGYGHRAITSGEGQFLAWNVFGRGNQLP